MAPTLYLVPASPPVRSVLITAKAILLKLDEKMVDVANGEHLKPEYLKLNPQHTVPTLVDDDGFTIWDSHAINIYLVTKYAKDDSLYPACPKQRAIINQRLHFDSGVAFNAGAGITVAILREGKTSINDADRESLNQVYHFMEVFLEGVPYIAGTTITLADYNLYTTLSTLNVLVTVDGEKYPRLTAWMRRVDACAEVEAGRKGLAAYKSMVESKLVE